MNEKERIEYLRKTLSYHARLYYVYDKPEISDYEYDMMFRELSELEENCLYAFNVFCQCNSPQ